MVIRVAETEDDAMVADTLEKVIVAELPHWIAQYPTLRACKPR